MLRLQDCIIFVNSVVFVLNKIATIYIEFLVAIYNYVGESPPVQGVR